MLIIGCDYHPSFQQIAWVDTGSGECGEQQLQHSNGEAEKFTAIRSSGECRCAWGWKRPGMPAGSSAY